MNDSNHDFSISSVGFVSVLLLPNCSLKLQLLKMKLIMVLIISSNRKGIGYWAS